MDQSEFIYPCAELSKIETIHASKVSANLQFLSPMTRVSKLVFSHVRVIDLAWAPSLTSLHLYESSISNDCLSRVTSLRELRLGMDFTINDDCLSNLRELSCLKLCDTPRITSRSVSLLTNLTELGLEGRCKVTNDGISGLTGLTKLDLYKNPLISFEGKDLADTYQY